MSDVPAARGSRAGRAVPPVPDPSVTGYRFGPVTVDVDVGSPAIAGWLREFLSPSIETTPGGHGMLEIRLTRSREWYDGLTQRVAGTARAVPCFSLDRGLMTLPGWQEGQALVLADAHHHCFYRIRNRTLDVVGSPGERLVQIGLMRIVREALTAYRQARVDLLDLHAAAFETRGCAVLIIGPRRSGKTTLLCYALASRNVRLIANDRVLVDTEDRPPMAFGVPTLTSIRPDTIRLFPQLKNRTDDPSLSPCQLAACFGASHVAGARLSRIVFPERADATNSWDVEELTGEEGLNRLCTCTYGGRLDRAAQTLFEEMAGGPASGRTAQVLAGQLSGQVRFFRCRLGTSAYGRPVDEWLEALALD